MPLAHSIGSEVSRHEYNIAGVLSPDCLVPIPTHRGLPHGQAHQSRTPRASSASLAVFLAETHHSHLNGALLLCDRTLL
jgi:hypothetical protein